MYFWLCIGGAVLLLLAWLISAILRTPWNEWKKDQETKKPKDPQEKKENPYENIR